MSDKKEKTGGGISASAVIGGGLGGAAAFQAADGYATKRTARAVMTSSSAREASPKFTEAVATILSEEKNIRLSESVIAAHLLAEEKENSGKIVGVHFTESPATKDFSMHVRGLVDGKVRTGSIDGIKKLPEGFTPVVSYTKSAEIGKLFDGGKESFGEKLIETMDKRHATGIKKAGGLFFGIKNVNIPAKSGIVAGTLAGVGVGALTLHAIFGGKHADTVHGNETATAPIR